ncbi:dual specificity protein phosphatase 23 isoform X1 [Onychostruthus taczanowskii]|uniref:dual specificity protein phosphatase 23 isoform X1 n=1 Tax=Onychostruthus taczanowskii TaxID=356909 RepID=UPI001B80CCFD|nr:dual specificity protein phosphatase 23 isoform X1 [Onychostruthus taczanowskii]XP_041261486.1 dual specificity protein phosphatase 23 isoform X1 [Onychostruthus taczanowskii]
MGSLEPPNFSWVVEGRLAGLAMPREPGHYRYLRERGVRHLVSLSERAPPHHGCCPQIQLHRLRVADFTPPSPEQIQSFLRIVQEANGRGERGTWVSSSATQPPCPRVQAVAVHCMLGHGRTGTLLACYLCKEQHLAGDDAIREIRRLRPGSIETAEQEQAVLRFCQCLGTGEES